MFAVRDQENLVHGQQQAAAAKPANQGIRGLQPKTPGNKYPKTPLRVPLNDENAPAAFGKSVKGKGIENLVTGAKKNATFDKNAFVTPIGPRTRAPLGNKTTNVKAKAFQTPAGPAPEKELEKTQPKQTTGRRPKRGVIHADAVKLEIHGDESPLKDDDVEFCPPKPKDIPYESEDFPDGCINYEVLKGKNLMRGIWKNYHVQVDENGVNKMEREYEEAYQKSAAKADEQIKKMMEEDWTVGDVPETFRHIRKKPSAHKPEVLKPKSTNVQQSKQLSNIPKRDPATITSRRAVSALSNLSTAAPILPKTRNPIPKSTFLSRSKAAPQRSVPSHASTMRHTAAEATSRSTIGYNKGRSASGALHPPNAPTTTLPAERKSRVLARSASNLSSASDSTITPARFAQKGNNREEWQNLKFLDAFLPEDEGAEESLGGALPECLRRMDEEDEGFVFKLGGGED